MSTDFYQTFILPHQGIIVKICRAYTDTQEDFEDFYQEVCLQLWKSKENFHNQSEWSTWVYRVALNVCMTLIKKSKKRKYLDINTDLTEEPTVFQNEELDLLYKAIRQLSDIDRAIILLYLEEKSYKEIAHIIGSNANNIGVRIQRIKQRLKKSLHGKIN